MGKYQKLPDNYFKFVNPVLMSLIGVVVYLMVMAWLDPDSISPTFFGRLAEFAMWLGTENNVLMRQLVLSLAAIHITEAIVAVYLCQKLRLTSTVTIAWSLQTLFFGIFSLWYLIWPQREIRDVTKSSTKAKAKKDK
ncbi:transmembrane protein 254 [Procambarus clarkii]|uniref:transmembrane protein 254 n=1 Tax=Procambarus clarkii TaxID=6728 RepID=UPI001E675DAA|nr:transmembrane protein 254-like [Procambarus clarkii]XP_045614154.1 transmembrane protein 254-like [Procambarus clarkii]XP_045614155.1 transmembrane protein 254-like [Procambarus clarkii]